MSELFSEMGKSNLNWTRPEKISVIKGNFDWDCYYNAETDKFGPLLEATVYTIDVPRSIENGSIVDYRELLGLN